MTQIGDGFRRRRTVEPASLFEVETLMKSSLETLAHD